MIKLEIPDTYDLLSAYCKVKGKWAVCVWLGYGDDARPPGRFYAMYVYPNGWKGLENDMGTRMRKEYLAEVEILRVRGKGQQ